MKAMVSDMKLFDLHCDTLSEIYITQTSLEDNELHISKKKAAIYDAYSQLFAIWSRNDLTDEENFKLFKEILNYGRQFLTATPTFKPYLAVEGAKLLGGDITRVDYLYEAGVRFLTLVWGGSCCIGGAHDTDEGLTDFGKAVVRRCFELGIVPDVSHASDATFSDAYDIALDFEKPLIATHSNSRSVCDHRRNLTDDMFRKLEQLGGIAGISLCRPHLTSGELCNIDTVVAHIERYLLLGGDNVVCLGCDLDGIGNPPDGISGVGDLYKIADRLGELNYPDELIRNIFWGNAFAFMQRNGILPYDNGEV